MGSAQPFIFIFYYYIHQPIRSGDEYFFLIGRHWVTPLLKPPALANNNCRCRLRLPLVRLNAADLIEGTVMRAIQPEVKGRTSLKGAGRVFSTFFLLLFSPAELSDTTECLHVVYVVHVARWILCYQPPSLATNTRSLFTSPAVTWKVIGRFIPLCMGSHDTCCSAQPPT
ncbi:hypothetical protein GDO81_028226 [Engystomops pustulosus]|uniref:Uncharacterized protein n=1 Tax=Engystomops pustulosus TaxID=76066 RepID=A0AAV6YK45_ENGPU|nr:hypothetical protein GDO81_028226 [Engystomops pustulosus]